MLITLLIKTFCLKFFVVDFMYFCSVKNKNKKNTDPATAAVEANRSHKGWQAATL